MNIYTIGALVCFAFGLYTLVMRFVNPLKFPKLQELQGHYGKEAGYIMHFAGFTLMPLGLGGMLLLRAMEASMLGH
ncbi:hypothetical protein WH50_19365 [Pokkaliibacter plantistimulans]|uniref:Uncharacterized protein n=2 Tax=Pseudomonadota TaxID=1224 RepID=A0ABX5LSQ0_9GAMM|nr:MULTISPECIES: hypothetical protein [Pokkaliibacter]MDH2435916.1 hypothetical protein [Pokkaliibacter sp. MBI-7]PPC74249.1 hypothetical protein C4K68_26695 [Pokkaliibacter plantistimulans]PXF29696.1 hypothetical protein WH50_19365 [Pokkaliibacter plantistimulans]